MKKSLLLIGAAATATLLAGGWVLAQSHGPGFGPQFMRGDSHAGKGPGMMMQHMGRGMGRGMGHGMMQHGGPGMGPGAMHGGPGSTFADPTQIDNLKSELGITPAQEAAWTKYATALQEAAAAMRTTREGVDPSTVSKLSPADRFAFVSNIREQAQRQFETVQTAANELLATLDDAQKAKAQEVLPGLAFGPGTMHGLRMGGLHHQH
jgi:hypothetical protein